MKILVVSHKPAYPARDGGCLAMQSLIKVLLQIESVELSVFSLYTHKHPKPTVDQLPREVNFKFSPINTQLKPIKALSHFALNKNYNLSRFYNQQVSEELQAFAIDTEPDIVIFESLFSLIYIHDLREIIEAKFIYRSHNIEYKIWQELSNLSNGPKKIYINQLWKSLKKEEEFWSKQADHILCISALDQEAYANWDIKQSSILWPSLSLQKAKESLNNKAYHLGAMDWQPNLEAWNWFQEEVLPHCKHKIEIHLAGKAMPEDLETHDWVKNHGEIKSVNDFLADKDICLVPLLSGSGIRMKVLEAASLGKALISTSKGVEGLELEGKKHFLLANDPLEFAKAMDVLYSDDQLRSALGNNLHLWAKEKLSPSAQASYLQQLFQQV